jgi:hypothetical protein
MMRTVLMLIACGATGFANDEWHGMAAGIATAAFLELLIRFVLWARVEGML